MNSSFWDNMRKDVWMNVPPPWRPDIFDIFVYIYNILCICIKTKIQKRNFNVLLLGCTAEIRGVLSFLRIPYTLIDFSIHMEAITRPNKDTLQQHHLHTWQNMLTKHEEYDIIIGDLVLNLLSKEDIPPFFLNLNTSLKKSGALILRYRTLGASNNTVCKKIKDSLHNIDKSKLYCLFANMQSLQVMNPTCYRNIIDQIISLKNKNKWLTVFMKDFIDNGAIDITRYFVYTEPEIKAFLSAYTYSIIFKKKPRNYIDTYQYLILKK